MSSPITPHSRFTLDQLFRQQQDLVNKVIESHIDMAQSQGQEFKALLSGEAVVKKSREILEFFRKYELQRGAGARLEQYNVYVKQNQKAIE